MLAGVCEGAAAGAAVLEIGAMLVHLAEFLAHEADDLDSEYGLGSHEFAEDGGGDEVENAVGLAVCAEAVGSRAEGRRKADDAARAQEAPEDFAAIVSKDGQAGKSLVNDVDATALGSLVDEGLVPEFGYRFGERLEGLEQFRRKLEGTIWVWIS